MSFRLPYLLPIVTLIHSPTCATSIKALNILKSAKTASLDAFDIDIIDCTQQEVTKDQLVTIAEYLGNDFKQVLKKSSEDINSTVVQEKNTQNRSHEKIGEEFMPKTVDQFVNLVKGNPWSLRPPILVDWNKGHAMAVRQPEKINDFLIDLGYMRK
ncbi:5388_t:CDS:1 [Ambispora leptoticha]|uniref:5388_t:CDS:1 n=1 Tax=Ambispora leptoticha TaxID=144679 RepID=A0A9N8WG32_9GLOM|nr:5388_t:CDS:1 [Ambispora leptoticha]